jgi:hypothetical protein
MAQGRPSAEPSPAFRDFVAEHLDRAARIVSAGASSDFYRIGPMRVTVRTAGQAMNRLLSPALAYLAADPAADAKTWTLFAIDGRATGYAPPAEWTLPVTCLDHQLRAHADTEGQIIVADGTYGVWSIAATKSKQALCWVRDAGSLPEWEPAAPFRILLHVMAQAEDLQLAHGAAVTTAGRGLLLTGPGGSGKSTTTLALIMNGAATAGEDFVMLAPSNPPVAYALYDTLKLTGLAAELCPEIMAAAANPKRPASEKARIHLCDVMPDRLRPSIELNALMLLRLGSGARTYIRPANAMAAMRALAPSSAFLLRVQMKETLARISAFVRSIPAYDVELSRDPIEAARAITSFAAEIPA